MRKPQITELLAPCGNMKTLKAAMQAGANAVYFGAAKFSARAFAGNFDGGELESAIEYAARSNVKTYIAINTLITDREMANALEIAKQAHNAGASAFIVQDLGLAANIRERLPNAVLHASTQMTACTAKDVNALERLGFSRVVLARELSREQIKAIAESTDVELEVFVHGALCSSYSGQCQMSSFIGGRSANRGKCAAPCRLTYKCGKKNGTLLSLKDLCMIDHIGELSEMGVASLKIEGRMKGEDYVRVVVGAYRAVLDGGTLPEKQKAKMLGVFNRGGYTCGYFTGDHAEMFTQTLKNPYSTARKGARQ
ncbi:MAG: U32 family peptidase [Defluviitaleaceae bacterium]|nr:U32 family peptidase [Defluviitaleaceae bacterium]MCL2263359.1 U32 family peptidase [Defluviitaleaceae bacterium]